MQEAQLAKAQSLAAQNLLLRESILKVQDRLVDGCDEEELQKSQSILNRTHLSEIVEERSTGAGLCGYPACTATLPPPAGRPGTIGLDVARRKIYQHVQARYCSSQCLARCTAFASNLPEIPTMIAADRGALSESAIGVPTQPHANVTAAQQHHGVAAVDSPSSSDPSRIQPTSSTRPNATESGSPAPSPFASRDKVVIPSAEADDIGTEPQLDSTEQNLAPRFPRMQVQTPQMLGARLETVAASLVGASPFRWVYTVLSMWTNSVSTCWLSPLSPSQQCLPCEPSFQSKDSVEMSGLAEQDIKEALLPRVHAVVDALPNNFFAVHEGDGSASAWTKMSRNAFSSEMARRCTGFAASAGKTGGLDLSGAIGLHSRLNDGQWVLLCVALLTAMLAAPCDKSNGTTSFNVPLPTPLLRILSATDSTVREDELRSLLLLLREPSD